MRLIAFTTLIAVAAAKSVLFTAGSQVREKSGIFAVFCRVDTAVTYLCLLSGDAKFHGENSETCHFC